MAAVKLSEEIKNMGPEKELMERLEIWVTTIDIKKDEDAMGWLRRFLPQTTPIHDFRKKIMANGELFFGEVQDNMLMSFEYKAFTRDVDELQRVVVRKIGYEAYGKRKVVNAVRYLSERQARLRAMGARTPKVLYNNKLIVVEKLGEKDAWLTAIITFWRNWSKGILKMLNDHIVQEIEYLIEDSVDGYVGRGRGFAKMKVVRPEEVVTEHEEVDDENLKSEEKDDEKRGKILPSGAIVRAVETCEYFELKSLPKENQLGFAAFLSAISGYKTGTFLKKLQAKDKQHTTKDYDEQIARMRKDNKDNHKASH